MLPKIIELEINKHVLHKLNELQGQAQLLTFTMSVHGKGRNNSDWRRDLHQFVYIRMEPRCSPAFIRYPVQRVRVSKERLAYNPRGRNGFMECLRDLHRVRT